MKDKSFNRNPEGNNQYELRSDTEIQKIIDSRPNWTKADFVGRGKLNLNGSAFTSAGAIGKLKERKFPVEQIIPIQDLLEELEKIQFGGPRTTSKLSSNLIDQSLETLKKLEKLCVMNT